VDAHVAPLMGDGRQHPLAPPLPLPTRLPLRLQGTMPSSPGRPQHRQQRGQWQATPACVREGSLPPVAAPAFVGPAGDRLVLPRPPPPPHGVSDQVAPEN
jgi:hypothetical protein